ncbi:energy-coupling factor transporter transmembrane component T family protein [Roseibium salinum]|uniref:Energy-coupling factor transporter transmembrane protein EcfT n=1 Tax=Roseibium salinum TaxID=1604349 RepID=A0ABT3R6K3_9HYPH|nr:energy-coupling factor transporter transmembrane protein EcfT [Roseibium sp. DSM 29163]MCX2724685.1 energy-coupling factor transporter transmembrane protein EcfT [Roseibium sp. DSM 29163]MDN3721326.1 energy-coupling factor transporter transmembrane protein EcfT [Roseibium salinum]
MISIYLKGNSWAHKLPAGLKLLTVAVGSLVLFRVTTPWIFLPCLVAVIAMYASLGREGLRQLKLLRGLTVFLVVILGLHWFSGTMEEGAAVVLRLIVLFLAANFVSITTRMDDMLDAVLPLFKPLEWFGISPRKPALSVALVLRFAPHLMQVFSMLREAWQARTGSKTSWRLIAPFAVQSLRMSDNVAEALKARGGSEGLSR